MFATTCCSICRAFLWLKFNTFSTELDTRSQAMDHNKFSKVRVWINPRWFNLEDVHNAKLYDLWNLLYVQLEVKFSFYLNYHVRY